MKIHSPQTTLTPGIGVVGLIKAILIFSTIIAPSCTPKNIRFDFLLGSNDSITNNLILSKLKNKEPGSLTPKEFLEILKQTKGPVFVGRKVFPKNWVKKDDLPFLLESLYNKDSVAKVTWPEQAFSRDNSTKKSTYGIECLRVLNGYVLGIYPTQIILDPDSLMKILIK